MPEATFLEEDIAFLDRAWANRDVNVVTIVAWAGVGKSTLVAGSGSYDTKSFVGSHGAVGGVPWPDIKEDAGCALAVAEWMNKRFENRGLIVTLKP